MRKWILKVEKRPLVETNNLIPRMKQLWKVNLSKIDILTVSPFPKLFAVTVSHMKTRPYLVNCKLD